MSLIQSASEHLESASRVIVVIGANGSGKTAFSISASIHAGELISGEKRRCTDTLVICGDNEGSMGAMDAGLEPGGIVDLSDCETWPEYKKALVPALVEIKYLVDSDVLKFIIFDLGLPASLIVNHVSPQSIADWGQVAKEGATLRQAFQKLKGATVIVNAHIKSAVAAIETDVAKAASEARASGGERSTFTIDAPGSISKPWCANASFIFAREVKRKADPMKRNEPPKRVFYTHTSASSRFDVKSRAHTVLKATEPGERSLNSMLQAVYKKNA